MTYIEEILEEKGPILTGELISILSKSGKSNDAIRKSLSRLKSPVMKLKGLFADNQTLFYLQKQYDKPEYYEGLIEAFKTSAKRYYAIIKAIEYHNGYIDENQLASYTFSPTHNLKGHKRFSVIIKDLIQFRLLVKEDGLYSLQNCEININNNFRHHKGIELAKSIVLNQFNDWAKNIGLISYSSGKFHSTFSKLQWGFVAPSYVSGTTKYSQAQKKITPSFVVADILLGKKIGIEEVSFFIRKIEIIKSQNVPNFIPFLLTDGYFEEDAFTLLKQKGIVVGLINKLFGEEYLELLKSLINTVTNAGAILKENPQEYVKLIEKLNKLVDGKTNNLRGDLFELAVGYYHSNLCQSIEIGKRIMQEGERREIDVYAIRQTELIIAECKGYKRKIDSNEINEWITHKVPVIYDWIKAWVNNEKAIIFEFWSTGGFTDDALDLLRTKSSNTKKYKIEYYSEKEIIEKARESKSQKIIEIMRDYFSNEIS